MLKLAFFFSLVPALAGAAVVPPVARQVSEARKLYEHGQYAEAARIYERIPQSSPSYLRTREELAWTYLRLADWPHLRGSLRDLNSKLVPLRWRLEGRVLSAMTHLKDCQYEAVKTDIENFQNEMSPFAAAIEKRQAISRNSKYWESLRAEISEAIFKMKFVRLELRSRMVMLTRAQMIDTPATSEPKARVTAGAQEFPVGADVWSDELFVKRGESESLCATLHKAKVIQ